MAFRLPGAVDRAPSAHAADGPTDARDRLEDERIRPARGLVFGLVMGAAIWVLIIALALMAIYLIAF